MLDDNQIKKHFGIELYEHSILFIDDESTEHYINLADILSISFYKSYVPIQIKLGYWINKLLFHYRRMGLMNNRNDLELEDYWNIYEVEIELKQNKYISRKVKGILLHEIEEFVIDFNTIAIVYKKTSQHNR